MQLKYDGKWWLDVILIILVFAIIIGGFVLYNFTKSESMKCINQPFIFGAKSMGNIYCSCYQTKNDMLLPFYFNDTSFIAKPVENYYPSIKNIIDTNERG